MNTKVMMRCGHPADGVCEYGPCHLACASLGDQSGWSVPVPPPLKPGEGRIEYRFYLSGEERNQAEIEDVLLSRKIRARTERKRAHIRGMDVNRCGVCQLWSAPKHPQEDDYYSQLGDCEWDGPVPVMWGVDDRTCLDTDGLRCPCFIRVKP